MLEPRASDIRRVREKLGMSQAEFATAFRLNVRTLQGWEIGRTKPEGAGAVLMWLIVHAPETILKLLKGK